MKLHRATLGPILDVQRRHTAEFLVGAHKDQPVRAMAAILRSLGPMILP